MSIPGNVPLEPLRGPFAVAVALGSLLVISRLGTADHRSIGVRSRLLHGVPWGTLATVAFVVAVYLFVQGGLTHPRRPLVFPFRSWSYFYPLGMVTAAFSHSGWGHLVGNLVATVAYATVAEYVWGHYPRSRGVQTFSSLRTNPYARILAVPAVSIVVGLFTALFALGPVIGFSGVVFAYAGFALVTRPLLGILAIVGSRILSLGLSAFLNPRVTTVPRPRVVTPWWTDVAIQGHGIGVLAGILVGVALLRSRGEWADPRRLWFALAAFAAYEGLWAVYVPGDGGRFILFRWLGVATVFALATVIVLGTTYSPGFEVPYLDVDRRTIALSVTVVLLASLSGSAVFYNVAPVDEQPTPEPSVQVGDYSVGYAENVEHGYVGAVEIPFVDDAQTINSSGVVVTNDRRYAWLVAVHPAVLKNRGRSSVLLGGLGWRERVYVNRTGWSVAGNGQVYQVYLRPAGESRTLAYTSSPVRASPVVAGRNVSMRSAHGRFEFVVSRDNATIGTANVPGSGESVTAGGITFRRDGKRIYAIANRTRVSIASRAGGN